MQLRAVAAVGQGFEAAGVGISGGIEADGVRIDRVIGRERRGNVRDLSTAVVFAILLGTMVVALL